MGRGKSEITWLAGCPLDPARDKQERMVKCIIYMFPGLYSPTKKYSLICCFDDNMALKSATGVQP